MIDRNTEDYFEQSTHSQRFCDTDIDACGDAIVFFGTRIWLSTRDNARSVDVPFRRFDRFKTN